MRRAGTVVAASLLAVLTGASFAADHSAAAAPVSCAAKITISGPTNGKLVLSPSSAKVAVGGCLSFTNSTAAVVNVAVTRSGTSAYTDSLAKGATTSVASSFAPKQTGHDTVAASTHVLLLKITGSGSVTVKSEPTKSPTPHPSTSSSPSGRHSSSSNQKAKKSPSPHKSAASTSPRPHATGFKLPPLPPLPTTGATAIPKGSSPVVAPGLPAATSPVLASESSTPVAAIVGGGPLETAENTSRGLPIAVAVLVVLGLASGYGRVLLATPRPVQRRPDRPAGGGRNRAERKRAKRHDPPAAERPAGSVDKRPESSVDKRPEGDHRV